MILNSVERMRQEHQVNLVTIRRSDSESEFPTRHNYDATTIKILKLQ